ncbi:hypothetical protein GGH95_005908 [Coemansia sp. RSA 1836]|nr:hypothetical protein GGH95_005908 [Coemansia sp. RSA 1836]
MRWASRVFVVVVLVRTIAATPTHSSVAQHQLFASDADDSALVSCQRQCTADRCRDRCANTHRLSSEAVLKRTQRCNQECHNEPEELIHMCIQRCSYYMADPIKHKLDYQKTVSIDDKGLLVANEHLRTRVRLMGPDGLPLLATSVAKAPADIPRISPQSSRRAAAADDDNTSWESRYRIVLVNSAGRDQSRATLWITVAAILYVLTLN